MGRGVIQCFQQRRRAPVGESIDLPARKKRTFFVSASRTQREVRRGEKNRTNKQKETRWESPFPLHQPDVTAFATVTVSCHLFPHPPSPLPDAKNSSDDDIRALDTIQIKTKIIDDSIV